MASRTTYKLNPRSNQVPYRPTKDQAQATVFNLMAAKECDSTNKKFILKFSAILLRSFDRMKQGEA